MLASVSRNLIWPIHEKLLGRRTFRAVQELEHSQWLCPNELRALQTRKLLALLTHAAARIPFYRERLSAAGFSANARCGESDPAAVLERLTAVTALDKEQIRGRSEEMVWREAPGGVFPYNTGGSTGDPLRFYIDRRRQSHDKAARIRSHRWFGVSHGDRELYLWGSPIESKSTGQARRLRDRLLNHKLLNAFDMSAETMDAYLDQWDRFKPTCLFGYPSSIALLIEHARRRCRALDTKSLKAVFVTGEVCLPQDRQSITDFLRVPVANGYGSREAGFIAHECPQGNMHITAESVVVEISHDGEPAEAGESGEIVITHLDAYAMPFIRYRTGDVGRLKPGRCTCGRGSPMMEVVEGRTTDFLRLPNGTTKHALSIIYPLRAMSGIRRFRVLQHENYDVAVEVVADRASPAINATTVRESVLSIVGPDVKLTVDFVSHIETTPSGKHRFVESRAPVALPPPREEATAVD